MPCALFLQRDGKFPEDFTTRFALMNKEMRLGLMGRRGEWRARKERGVDGKIKQDQRAGESGRAT